MTSDQAKGLLTLQSSLTQLIANFGAFRLAINTALASPESEFVREELEQLRDAIELTESESKAANESLTQKLIAAIAGGTE